MSISSICTVCNEVFASRSKLFIHIKKAHDFYTPNLLKSSLEMIPKPDSRSLEDQIVFLEEDDAYRMIIKPQGIATMGGKGITLTNTDKLILPDAFKLELEYKKAIVCHRLDKDTGGLIICSKTRPNEVAIKECFRHKLVFKKYIAIVAGELLPLEGFITEPISNKPSVTRYKVTKVTNSAKYGKISTVDLFPITGRRHQLRRHLHHVKHCIIGDRHYAHCADWPENSDRMFLWSVGIELPHPSEVERLGIIGKNEINLASCGSDDEDEEPLAVSTDIASSVGSKRYASDVSPIDHTANSPGDKNDHTTTAQPIEIDYSNKGYGCEHTELIKKNVRMIRVEIPEPEYFEDFRQYHERTYEELKGSLDTVDAQA